MKERPKAKNSDLGLPEHFINRELSLLAFNERVLAQALDPAVPLLERLKYLCISCSNLDEFFEVRVAGVKQKIALGALQPGVDGLSPTEELKEISARAHQLVDEQYRVLNEVLIPELGTEQIRFVRRTDWIEHSGIDVWLRNFFEENVLPVLSPIGLDPAHPFPRILNKSLNFIVSLEGKDAFGRTARHAIVQAPRSLARLIQLPPGENGNGPHDIVFLSSVIHAYVDELFPGMTVTGCYQFRVTRNSDLFVDEEEVDDLLRALKGELPYRQYGECVRLEVAHNCPETLWRFLLDVLHLEENDFYQCNGPVNLNRLMALSDMIDEPSLKFPGFTPRVPRELAQGNIFDEIKRRDVLLHHPFDAFGPVVDFLRQAARDPNVLAIKQTLYRTGEKSAVVDALLEAARMGKEVTVIIELRARFDEAENIDLAAQLQEAGAHVVYGVVGHKTHAKMILVVRREEAGLVKYAHLATGNYHPKTARLYTDYGLFTADEDVADDVHNVFLQLTSLGKASGLKKLLQSPFTLHKGMIERINREITNAKKGRPAKIIIKMNSLVESEAIQTLYKASRAGVEVHLIIRGVCCLRPGIPGVSENIHVRSIIGRFLEHTRVYYFHNNDKPELFCSSADWMDRNFFQRVETCFPLTDKRVRRRVLRDLRVYLADSEQSWVLQSDGRYQRRLAAGDKNKGKDENRLNAQSELMRLANRV